MKYKSAVQTYSKYSCSINVGFFVPLNLLVLDNGVASANEGLPSNPKYYFIIVDLYLNYEHIQEHGNPTVMLPFITFPR